MALWSWGLGLLGFMVWKHLEIAFPHSWPKNREETRSRRAKGPEVLAEAGAAACSSLRLPARVPQATRARAGLNPSTCTWVVLIYVSGSCPGFPAHISLPQQSTQPSPCTGVPRVAPCSSVRCRPTSAGGRTHAHTLHAMCLRDTRHFYYFSSCGFPAHACPETCSALLPTQAGLQSGRHPAPSVPAEATGLPGWHRVGAWLCGGWCRGLQPVQ